MKAEGTVILYFDGVCNLCNKLVLFVMSQDVKERVHFSSLQSHPEWKDSKTVILQKDDRYYYKSDAILQLLLVLGGKWNMAKAGYVFPKFLRDKIYDFVARKRYGWFGISETCLHIPSAKSARFLQEQMLNKQ